MIPWIFVLATRERTRTAAAAVNARTMTAYWAALKSPVLWRLGFGFSVISLAVSAMIVHMVPILRDFGVSPAGAAATPSPIGFWVIPGPALSALFLAPPFAPH